jgi:hypothetical protein
MGAVGGNGRVGDWCGGRGAMDDYDKYNGQDVSIIVGFL